MGILLGYSRQTGELKMPNVDLSPILPALAEAVEPFDAAMVAANRMRINPATQVRSFAPLAILQLGDIQRLLDSVNAIRRMAGDIK